VIHKVSPSLVADLWPAIQGFAQRACKRHPFLHSDDILAGLLFGRSQLFIATKAGSVFGFAAVEVLEYSHRSVANVVASGGDFGFLSVLVQDMLPEMEQWAAEQGADTFAIHHFRPGWKRIAKGLEGSCTSPLAVTWRRLHGGRQQRRNYQADQPAVGRGAALS
jgi:hypothetical protein